MRREIGVSGVGRDVAWGLGRDGVLTEAVQCGLWKCR